MGAFNDIPKIRVEIESIRRTILHAFEDYGDRFTEAVSKIVGEVLTPDGVEAALRNAVYDAVRAEVAAVSTRAVRSALMESAWFESMVKREVERHVGELPKVKED